MSAQPSRGIGGGASENVVRQTIAEQPKKETAKEPQEESVSDLSGEKVECASPWCKEKVKKEWRHCPRCGHDQSMGDPEKRLGIKLTEEDISDYLFKGFITKEIKILGRHKATMKSGQPKDLQEIDAYLMNGDWSKDEHGEERRISDFFMKQMNAMCQTAACVVKVDGEFIGDSLEDRMKWLLERGSGFVDMLSQRVSWFNQAISKFLDNEDNLTGS